MKFQANNKEGAKSNRKGVPNKANREVREILSEVCRNTIDNLGSLLDEIDNAKDRIDALSKLLPYFVSKMPNVNINAIGTPTESIQPPNVTFTQRDMSNGTNGVESETVSSDTN